MKVITSGSSYIDIDAYGGIVALAELYNKCGEPAVATSSAPLNESITSSLRQLEVSFEKEFVPSSTDEFVLVDISFPYYFDPIVADERVVAIVDHHPGHEEHWKSRLGSHARIEQVGAACTQVFEEWKSRAMLSEMSGSSAKLLAAGILDNTLNFGAKISTQRDVDAYSQLAAIAGLPDDWPSRYFSECQQSVEDNLEAALKNDLKTGMQNLPEAVGQLSVWDAKLILEDRFTEIASVMQEKSNQWLLNIISISDGQSWLVATDSGVKKQISVLLGVSYVGSIARADRMWLRKEILAAALAKK